MKKTMGSLTAEGIAFVRAMETRRSEDKRICYDPFAEKFFGGLFWFFDKVLGLLQKAFGEDWLLQHFEKKGAGVYGFLISRARYIDDYLQSSIDEGIDQLVIMGAGYDSRAYRFKQLRTKVKVFEVDHPATQSKKKGKLQKIFGSLPSYVTYVAVDFNEQTLEQCLYKKGYNDGLKTLFIWEGVTTYLTPEAVDSTLAFVINHSGEGSSIIFDYVYKSVIDGTCERKEIDRMKRYKGISGEAPVFGLDPDEVVNFMIERGYSSVTNVKSTVLKAKYFHGVNATLEVAPVYGIGYGKVKH